MIAAMDWLTIIPLIVGVISNLSTCTSEALAGRLLTILVAVLIIGSVSVLALMAFACLWMKRSIDEQHASPTVEPFSHLLNYRGHSIDSLGQHTPGLKDDRKPTGCACSNRVIALSRHCPDARCLERDLLSQRGVPQ